MVGMANSICDGDVPLLADKINHAFILVSQNIPTLKPPAELITSEVSQVPDNYIISLDQTIQTLVKVKSNKAVGPDQIPNWILKTCAKNIAPAICSIWNASIAQSHLPQVWKSADICPLAKVTPPTKIDKHLRPISLTPVLSKGLESFIKTFVMDIFEDILDENQFGSIKGSSTIYALLTLLHQWHLNLDKGGTGSIIRVVLLDFSKAFDLVDHNIILQKFKDAGIPPILLKWIAVFLQERKQRVKVEKTYSSWSSPNAGVPQGTLLGPVTFLAHINDLKTCCPTVKYVDDTTLWESCDRNLKNSKIQQATDEAQKWTNENNMRLNREKSTEMVIYFGKKSINPKPIQIDGENITQTNKAKLLGVMINDKLDWHDHVELITSKCAKRLYLLCLLKRAGISTKDMVKVYVALIRSVLEYACEIWHGGLTTEQSGDLENIQKRALNIVFFGLPYEEALVKADLELLAKRRTMICTNLFKKIMKNDHKLNYLLPAKRKSRNLRKERLYEPFRARTKRFQNSPLNYMLFNLQDKL
jgi:hypothetical protein